MRHVIVVGGDPAAVDAPNGVAVHGYAELLAGQPDEFDWVDVDERSAAAMCYTSGTTGNPKGVVYSHRSIWLHSMQVCMTDGMGLAQSDRSLVIVPMFHAMAWGLPYASMMVGASLIMPDRFLQPAPIADIIAAEQPTMAGAVPTIWQGLLAHLETHPQDLSTPAQRRGRRLGVSAVADARVQRQVRRAHHARVGHDGDVPAGQPGQPARLGHR